VQAPPIGDLGLRIADFAGAALLLIAVGCRSTPTPPAQLVWQADLALALDDARKSGKPFLVVAVIGDIDRQC